MSERKDLKCALCSENHPANYKGCKVYKELQQKQYPKLRTNIYQQRDLKYLTSTRSATENVSYATVTQGREANENNPKTNTSNLPTTVPEDRISRLEKLVEDLAKRMDTMMNIVSKLLDKLN